MRAKERDAPGGILQVRQAACRADIMGLIRNDAGYHQRLAEMHGSMIVLAANGLANRQNRRGLRRRFDGSQSN
jgi:hypothetical protein